MLDVENAETVLELEGEIDDDRVEVGVPVIVALGVIVGEAVLAELGVSFELVEGVVEGDELAKTTTGLNKVL